MTQFIYSQILYETLLPFAHSHFGTDFVLHQDNSPIHTSKLCENLLKEEEVLWVQFYN